MCSVKLGFCGGREEIEMESKHEHGSFENEYIAMAHCSILFISLSGV